jgi:hypothetical protein
MTVLKMTLVASIVVMLNVIKLSVIKQTEPLQSSYFE